MNLMKDTASKITNLANKIVKKVSPEKIILFGSHAWGTPNKDSDFDFFVIQESKDSKRKRQLLLRTLLLDFNAPADILSYTYNEIKTREKKNDSFVKKVLKEGKVLYEK